MTGTPTIRPSPAMQQATVNLLADMGAQPATLMSGLVAGHRVRPTPRRRPRRSPRRRPARTFTNGSTVTVTGTATDTGGGVVAGVEVSTDGGTTWHPVTTMSAAATSVTWSYTWSATGNGPVTIESRATDDSGNIETPGAGRDRHGQLPVRPLRAELHARRSRPRTTRRRSSSA